MKKFTFLLTLLAPLIAIAQLADEGLLKDYIGLTKLMRANGINPVQVEWNSIEMMCLGLKKATNFVPYNRCRLQKSMDQMVYRSDDGDCADIAASAYPRSLVVPLPAVIATTTNRGQSISTIQQPAISTSELAISRDAAFSQCMRGRGWVNAHSWQQGRNYP